jgi:hypothetical protein
VAHAADGGRPPHNLFPLNPEPITRLQYNLSLLDQLIIGSYLRLMNRWNHAMDVILYEPSPVARNALMVRATREVIEGMNEIELYVGYLTTL